LQFQGFSIVPTQIKKMMKKTIATMLMAVLCLMVTSQLQAQTEKGRLYVGFSTNNLRFLGGIRSSNLSFNVNSSLGYFVADNLVVGGRLGVGYSQQIAVSQPYDFKSLGIRASGFARYYVPLTQRVKIPVEAEIGAQRGFLMTPNNTTGTWSGHAGVSTGLSLFFSERASLDLMGGYELVGYSSENGNYGIGSHFKGSVGLSLYLNSPASKKFK
jgi:hypothetical protein